MSAARWLREPDPDRREALVVAPADEGAVAAVLDSAGDSLDGLGVLVVDVVTAPIVTLRSAAHAISMAYVALGAGTGPVVAVLGSEADLAVTAYPLSLYSGDDRPLAEQLAERDGDAAVWLAERVAELASETPSEVEAPSARDGGGSAGRRLTAESFATIRAERARWVWDQRIPLGTASLLVGREKLGKSTLTVELAARLSRGELEGDLAGRPAATLIVSYEDSASRTVKPRLMAAGADLRYVHRVRVTEGDARDLVSLPADVAAIGELAVRYGARLIVVDPLSASLGADVNGHRDQDVRRALAPLVALAEERDLAVLCLAHFNKGAATDALSRVLGSRGLTAAVRSVLAFGVLADTEDGSPERVLVHAASNLAPEAPSLACRVEGRIVTSDDGETIPTSRLVIVGETTACADDLLVTRSSDERTDTEAAADWLADELADGRWHEGRQVKARARAEGMSERTLQRACKSLGVETRRAGFGGVTEWRLPVAPTHAGATGATGAGATEQTRIPEPNPPHAGPQSRQTSETGATGPIERHPDDDALMRRLDERRREQGS